MNFALFGILVYLAVQLAIGAYVARRVQSDADYFVAGRSVGPWLATFSIFSTWFGAETCIATSGAVYARGLSGARADPFGYTLCLLLMGLLLAGPLWRRKLTTLADLYTERFSPSTARLVAVLLIPTSLLWASAQLRAFSQILSSIAGWPAAVCLVIATIVVVAYTSMGGMIADITTDFVQAGGIMLGLGILVVVLIAEAGGLGPSLAGIDTARLSFVAEGESWWTRFDTWLIPIAGSIVSQELIARVLASRSENVAVRSALSASVIYLLVGGLPVLVGLLAPSLPVGQLADPEQIMPSLAERYLSPFMYVIFAGALMSAILSTVDSTILACTALFAHNVLPQRAERSEREKVRFARRATMAFGFLAYLGALWGTSIYELIQASTSFATAGILVVTLFGIYTPLGNARLANITLVVGAVAVPVAEHALGLPAPYAAGLLAATAAYALPSLLLRERAVNAEPAA